MSLKDLVLRIPGVRWARLRLHDRAFERRNPANLFRGVYGSFVEAAAAAPRHRPLGYDHPGPASMYRERLTRVYANDYPVILWLDRVLSDSARIFDFGGHVGVAHYAYAPYLRYPKGLDWLVYDCPAVCESGKALAAEKGNQALRFTSSLADVAGEVFLAAGSLQYAEESIAEILSNAKEKPKHILINKTPMTQEPSFVTVQSIGVAYCPYRIFNRREFVASIEALGYRLVDSWENPELACWLPLDPAHSVLGYSGFYFVKDASSS